MTVALDAVHRALGWITPSGVITGVRTICAGDVAGLTEDESALVARAVPGRRREFATGRALLHELATETGSIGRADDGRPLLPSGRPCALAHDSSIAVAAVAGRDIVSVGIDVEPHVPLGRDEVAIIRRDDDDALPPTALFALKEAVYKAWSGAGGWMLDHHDVRIRASGVDYSAIVVGEFEFAGQWVEVAGRTVALVVNSAVAVSDRSPTISRSETL